MKGSEFAEVRDAIMNAFTANEFDAFLFEALDYNREHNVEDGAFRKVVGDVLMDFQNQGREAALIAKVAEARPAKEAVQKVYQQYAAARINESLRAELDAKRAAAIRQFGLLGEISFQIEGAKPALPLEETKPALSKEDAPSGLEKAITGLGYIQYRPWLRRMMALEGMVCRVEIQGHACGTGFLVGPDLVLTNYHVIEPVINQPAGDSIEFRFDYGQSGIVGTPVKAAPVGWLLASAPYCPEENTKFPETAKPDAEHLDFALIKLAEPIGSQPLFPHLPDSALRGWVEIPKAPPNFDAIASLMILQHPQLTPSAQTAPLQLALDTRPNIKLLSHKLRVRYSTNTEHGSSGSPCFDIHGNLVALHHLGDPGGLNTPPQYNQGIPIHVILDRLQALNLYDRVTQSPPAPTPAVGVPPAPSPMELVRPPVEGDKPPPPTWPVKPILMGLGVAVLASVVIFLSRDRIPSQDPDPQRDSPTTTPVASTPVPGNFITRHVQSPITGVRVRLTSADGTWQAEQVSGEQGRVSFQIDPAKANQPFSVTLPDHPGFNPQNYGTPPFDGAPINVPAANP